MDCLAYVVAENIIFHVLGQGDDEGRILFTNRPYKTLDRRNSYLDLRQGLDIGVDRLATNLQAVSPVFSLSRTSIGSHENNEKLINVSPQSSCMCIDVTGLVG